MEASNQAMVVVASSPPEPAPEVESPLSTILFEASQQVQTGMEELLKMISEIDAQSAEVIEEIEKCKENAHHRGKSIQEEKARFQKAAFAILDMLNTDGKPGQLLQLENGHNF